MRWCHMAAKVGAILIPSESEHIVSLVRRDLPYYEAMLAPDFVAGMNRFARALGILDVDVPYSSVVAKQFSGFWN